MLLILLDIHRNILTAQGVLKYTTDCLTNVEIIVEQSKLVLSFCRNSSFHILNIIMPEKCLLPSTVSSVCCNSSKDYLVMHDKNIAKLNFPLSNPKLSNDKEDQTLEITFRLHIANSNVIENCALKGVSDMDFKRFMHDKFKSVQAFCIVCTDCGTSLSEKNISFQCINKYYDGMSELAESWFCHKHDDHGSVKLNVDSLYIGDMHFYFHYSTVKSFTLSESSKELKCIKCSSILSLKKRMDNPHYIGFFCDKIMLVNSETESNNIKNYKLDSALFSLCSIIQDLLKSTVSCKIYLQCKIDEATEILLLWINSQKVLQFLLDVINDDVIPHEKDFKAEEVYKVLYCICPFDSELSKKWKYDFGVDFYQISDNMMGAIRALLQKSSKYFPEDQKKVKEFSFGYLPVYVSM